MFEAIRCADYPSLCMLTKTFIGMGNDPAALLCLDHVFSSPFKLRNFPLAEVQASLSLYLDYIHLLNKLKHDESLAEGSDHQRLFGFQALGGNRYLVPEHTLLHQELANKGDSSRRGTDGYRCDYEELIRGIIQFILSRTLDRTKTQNSACCDIHGFSPCLHLLVQGECNPPKGKRPCVFQHIPPEQLTIDWYHARLRLILLQFQILNSARYDDLDVKRYVLACLTRNTCGCSLNVKLLARDIILSISSTLSEARIVRES
jgi:hypothetical protein